MNLNLTIETLWIGVGYDLLVSMLGKYNLLHLIGHDNCDAIDIKMDGPILNKKL